MTRIIGIGVIGMGWMGEVHSRSYRAIPDRFHESGIFPRLVVCADAVEAREFCGPLMVRSYLTIVAKNSPTTDSRRGITIASQRRSIASSRPMSKWILRLARLTDGGLT